MSDHPASSSGHLSSLSVPLLPNSTTSNIEEDSQSSGSTGTVSTSLESKSESEYKSEILIDSGGFSIQGGQGRPFNQTFEEDSGRSVIRTGIEIDCAMSVDTEDAEAEDEDEDEDGGLLEFSVSVSDDLDLSNRRSFVDLPNDLYVAEILPYLDVADLCRVSVVNHRFHDLATCDALWLNLRNRLFKSPESIKEDVYQTYVGYFAEVGRVAHLFKRIPCVYSSFLSLFGILCVLFFVVLLAGFILVGFRWMNRTTVGLTSFFLLAAFGGVFALTVVGLLFGMEIWVRCYGIRMGTAYGRLVQESAEEERLGIAGVPLLHRFTSLGGGYPEESEHVQTIYSALQLLVWFVSMLPCLGLALLLSVGLRSLVPGFEHARCTLVAFVIAIVFHEIVFIFFMLKLLFSMKRSFADTLDGQLGQIGNIGSLLDLGAKCVCLAFIIPLCLAADGLILSSYVPVTLIGLYLILGFVGFLIGYVLLVFCIALCIAGCRHGGTIAGWTPTKVGMWTSGICMAYCVMVCATLAFGILSIVRFVTSLTFNVFWVLFPLCISVGVFVTLSVLGTVVLGKNLFEMFQKKAKRRRQIQQVDEIDEDIRLLQEGNEENQSLDVDAEVERVLGDPPDGELDSLLRSDLTKSYGSDVL